MTRPTRLRRSERGSILVATLALVALLAAFAGAATFIARAGHLSSRGFAEDIRAEMAARAAVEWVVGQAGGRVDDLRTGRLVIDRTEIVLDVRPESARVDINKAPVELISGVFRANGIAPDAADLYAARIVDWRDDDDEALPLGAELDDYRAHGRADGPRDAPFAHVAELALVLDLPIAAIAAVEPYVTVASGLAGIDPRYAHPKVIAAVPGAEGTRLRELLADQERGAFARPGSPAPTRAAGPEKYFTGDRSGAFRISGAMRLKGWGERTFDAVVAVIDGEAEPFRIVSLQWFPRRPAAEPAGAN